jgi:hypothetical protein
MARTQAEVPNDELQDFWAGCLDRGYNASEFMISAHEDTPVNLEPIVRIVAVQRTFKGNVLAHQFDGSNGRSWVVPALDYLQAGGFGTP